MAQWSTHAMPHTGLSPAEAKELRSALTLVSSTFDDAAAAILREVESLPDPQIAPGHTEALEGHQKQVRDQRVRGLDAALEKFNWALRRLDSLRMVPRDWVWFRAGTLDVRQSDGRAIVDMLDGFRRACQGDPVFWRREFLDPTLEHNAAVRAFLAVRKKEIQHERRKRGTTGLPGRRGYSVEILKYALGLRKQNPRLTAHVIRLKCRKQFPDGDMPLGDGDFRRWMNRPRKNRAK